MNPTEERKSDEEEYSTKGMWRNSNKISKEQS